MLECHSMATKAHHTVANIPARRGGIPDSWIKAAGILRGKKIKRPTAVGKARNGLVMDPKARLDAWERARGALTKSRMQKVLHQLRTARKEWDRLGR